MDKYEYKVRADEIKSLIAEGEFAEAVKIADTIDWRRVRSVMMLCTVSDLYKINRRYQESKDILLLAYEKHPSGRAIVYSLCELSIKMEEYIQAVEYYKEFVQIAPKDTGKYVLLYRLYEAQDVSLEERIAVLEEFKKRDYREKWAYELAYLYHRIGLTTKCIEECDEMYLWFGEGKYVLKALELKALHVPLNAEQQEKYDTWLKQRDSELSEDNEDDEEDAQDSDEDGTEEDGQQDNLYAMRASAAVSDRTDDVDVMNMPTTELPEVKTVDVGQYNTLNLQMALAESMKEIMTQEAEEAGQEEPQQTEEAEQSEPQQTELRQIEVQQAEPLRPELRQPEAEQTEPQQTELRQTEVKVTQTWEGQEEQEPLPEKLVQESAKQEEQTLLPFSKEEPADTPAAQDDEDIEQEEDSIAEKLIAPLLQETSEIPSVEQDAREIMEQIKKETITAKIPAAEVNSSVSQKKYDYVLSQEYDGQIRLVVPDEKVVEKQITGQLSIEDIMAEWETMKKDNEQKRMEDVRRRILNRTGSLFADFDEATKNGLLEELEKAFLAAIMEESDKEAAIKKVISSAAILPKKVSDEPITDDDEVEELEEIAEPEEAITVQEPIEPDVTEQKIEEATMAQLQHQGNSYTARELTEEEEELFGRYAQHKKAREQLVNALDNMSMAAYTGNVIITGEDDGCTMPLAKNLIREMQYNDNNFSGKVAKISAASLNKKDVAATLKRLNNGALIIENAAELNAETVTKLNKVLENENIGLLLILEDAKKRMNKLLSENAALTTCFNLRVDVEPLDDEALVAYAKQYAEENEYSIDEFGVLALHTRIADMQTSDHEVSVAEVRELVDDAIYYANKKTPKHFVDILLAKRYDEEDMIILREKDFMHY